MKRVGIIGAGTMGPGIAHCFAVTPHIDDGVLLNMAPLWEVIPSWQAEPKKAWQTLERGEYDWAYQAMDYWPDRAKGKCKTDKSLTIAHGLDN